MEVSSHALDQGRIDGLQFDAAIFTCLGSDHLDYHQTLERYAEAKRRIFSYIKPGGYAVVNGDDAYGRILLEDLRSAWRSGPAPLGAGAERVLSYGADPSVDIGIEQAECAWAGTRLVLRTPWGLLPMRSPLLGRHNAMNVAGACAASLALGVPPETVQRAIEAFPQVPGRLERIPNDAGVHAVVDFAHTADALRLVLLTLRDLVRGQVIVVFGCGGDRDQSKRPAMGRVASLLADHVVLTSDNPRSEDPAAIIEQIRGGLAPGFARYQVVVDREQAIRAALAMARLEDAVLVAGKGHETQQIFENITVPFSDRSVIERFFAQTTGAVSV
jgi:UDP-N-acetylmuramyl-tripeptide synthetase